MQNGIEGCFPQKIIPHTLRRCALSSQASSRRFLFLAEHDKCGRAIEPGTGQKQLDNPKKVRASSLMKTGECALLDVGCMDERWRGRDEGQAGHVEEIPEGALHIFAASPIHRRIELDDV